MRRNLLTLLVMGCVAFGALSYDAFAGGQNPSSVLVFPIYTTNTGEFAVITITNTSFDDIWVRLVWVDGEDCTPEDSWIMLTGRDTFTFVDGSVNPESETGFLYAYVVEDENSKIEEYDMNVLIGQELIFYAKDGEFVEYGLNAYGFKNVGSVSKDEYLFLDGNEYELAPYCVYFPRFFGQKAGFKSEVILINFTGGRHFTAKADVLVYNDNEVPYSTTVEYDCWDMLALEDVSAATKNSFLKNTKHDEDEPVGIKGVETGWIEFKADYATNTFLTKTIDNAAMLAVLVEMIGQGTYAAADLPWIDTDADHKTGTLWSTHPLGTPYSGE